MHERRLAPNPRQDDNDLTTPPGAFARLAAPWFIRSGVSGVSSDAGSRREPWEHPCKD